jgi:hypothetical protein
MELDVDIDYSEFEEALRQYSYAYTNKDIPDIINQAARDVCFTAYRKTRGAKKSSIKKFAPSKKAYQSRLKKSSIKKFAPSKKAYQGRLKKSSTSKKRDPGRLFFALQNSSDIGQKTVTTGIGKGATRRKFIGSKTDRAWALYNRRMKSIKYIATGWIAAAQKLGANTKVKPSSSLLKDSGASKAKPGRFYADIINGAKGARKVGKPALQSALKVVAVSKIKFAKKRLEKLNKKHSAR